MFSGESLHQEREGPWPVTEEFQFVPIDWPEEKFRPNARNISAQHFETLLGATCCAFGHPVATCCDMLGIENRTSAHARLHPGATMLDEPGQTTATSCNIH